MTANEHPVKEKLVQAYDQILETSKEILDMAKREATPAILDAIDKAKEKIEEVNELTVEEIDRISEYVIRDIQDAAEYIAEGERELSDWLRLDALYIEDKVLEVFSGMVDHTQMALNQLRENALRASEWRTGEVTGVGTLVCAKCGEKMQFKKTGHIPPCPKCHHTVFNRNDA